MISTRLLIALAALALLASVAVLRDASGRSK